ncbi:MspA family porin [Gordonia crocea]|uniref:MspA protein n=1 Tax=Gordonia crocea TaxID=589162 RepID=A0A7I9UWG0_9ACTN|nr:MspA family porin [Gordonia crocea]GED97110.1 hypothetical protein nbrc107697_11490 [Gordonia crocea]
MNKREILIAAATGATVVATAASVLAPALAGADTRVVLPSQTDTKRMGDGTLVTMSRSQERAIVNASVGGTPVHRNAAVSGQYRIRTSEPAKKIQLRAGYVVGCQVNFGGVKGQGGSGTIDTTPEPVEIKPSGGATFTLGPGQATNYYIVDTEKADDFGNEKHEPKVTWKKKDDVKFGYYNTQLTLNGCAGFAQARSIANVLVETKHATEYLVFYGRPFSLG